MTNRRRFWCLSLPALLLLASSGCDFSPAAPARETPAAEAPPAQATGPEPAGAGSSSPAPAADRRSESLMMRAVVNGRETALYEKVVVTSATATIAGAPGEQGEIIEPWAIFFRLWTDDRRPAAMFEGQPYIRVGNAQGRHLGWIRQKDVTSWNTRFVLEPLQPVPGRVFSVDLGQNTTAEFKTSVENKRRFALITETPAEEAGDETLYPVVVYTGAVQAAGSEGSLRQERNALQDLKLEVVFVVESSQQMEAEYDDVSALESVRRIAKGWVDRVRKNPELAQGVRLGLVEFQDQTPGFDFVSRRSCALTSNLDEFLASINAIDPPSSQENERDDFWSQDALAGLDLAISESGWSENSSKHIVVFGATQPQLYAKGEGPNPLGRRTNFLVEMFDRSNEEHFKHGYNTTGLTVAQIIGRANPRGGGDVERARNAKTFHSVLVGYDRRRKLRDEFPEFKDKIEPILRDVAEFNDQEVLGFYNSFDADGKKDLAISVLVLAYGLKMNDRMREFAKQTYGEISRNQEVDGMNLVVEPTAAAIEEAIAKTDETISDAFDTLAGVRTGKVGTAELERNNNAVTQTYYAIVGAAAAKFQDQPTVKGYAAVRDRKGREVAHKRVIVSEDELRRLRSTLDAIRTKFQAMVRKEDRQHVDDVLDKLKAISAQTAAGQAQFDPDVQLKDVITDLPLRTTVLDTSPRSIAVMTSEAFRDWLSRLDVAVTRADELLSGQNWLVLSPLAENEKFTFLRLSELP